MLIRIKDAAERIGVDRQTIRNWIERGFIKQVNSDGKNFYVVEDEINEIVKSNIVGLKEKIVKIERDLQQEYDKEFRILHDLRREVFMLDKFGKRLTSKDFFISVANMLESFGILCARERDIVVKLIMGEDIVRIADDFYLSRQRVAQIYFKACRKTRNVEKIKVIMEDYDRLRQENALLINENESLGRILKMNEKLEDDEIKTDMIKAEDNDDLIKMLNTSILDLGFSVRTLNCLKFADCETVADIVRFQANELLRFRNFGKKSLQEIQDFFDLNGLEFGMDVDQIYKDRVFNRIR